MCRGPDFDAVSEHTSHVSSNVLKERVRVGRNRPRKAPSKEHLRKISLGDIGDDVPAVQLKLLEDDEVRDGCKDTNDMIEVLALVPAWSFCE